MGQRQTCWPFYKTNTLREVCLDRARSTSGVAGDPALRKSANCEKKSCVSMSEYVEVSVYLSYDASHMFMCNFSSGVKLCTLI